MRAATITKWLNTENNKEGTTEFPKNEQTMGLENNGKENNREGTIRFPNWMNNESGKQ